MGIKMSPKQFASSIGWLCEVQIDYINRLVAMLRTNNCAGGGGCLIINILLGYSLDYQVIVMIK